MERIKQIILFVITLVLSMAGEAAYASVSSVSVPEDGQTEEHEVCIQRPEDTASRTLNHLLSHRGAGVPGPCVQAGQPVPFSGFRPAVQPGMCGVCPADSPLYGGGFVEAVFCSRRSVAGYLYLIERIQI